MFVNDKINGHDYNFVINRTQVFKDARGETRIKRIKTKS
jgi:hypothetical protein